MLKYTTVMTVIACRNMWLQAKEKVRTHLTRLGARLVGNAALVDECGTMASFLSTPLWMLTGKRGPFPLGLPRSGVSDQDIADANRSRAALIQRLNSDQPPDATVWQALRPATVRDQ